MSNPPKFQSLALVVHVTFWFLPVVLPGAHPRGDDSYSVVHQSDWSYSHVYRMVVIISLLALTTLCGVISYYIWSWISAILFYPLALAVVICISTFLGHQLLGV